ncbi:hypothetical protein, partial [Bacteroides sp.]|uniref:hypothetical protein n=1 Tax=Bacteroides sp. TaxID=29523 RepID=UPI00260B6A54
IAIKIYSERTIVKYRGPFTKKFSANMKPNKATEAIGAKAIILKFGTEHCCSMVQVGINFLWSIFPYSSRSIFAAKL